MKNSKAITLVALIITIIILLILATVSINLVMNGGIIDKSKSAVDKYSFEEGLEQIKLAKLEYETAKLTGTNLSLKDYMQQSLEKIYGQGKVTITPNSETEDYPLLISINGKQYLFNANGTSRAKYGIDEYDVARHPETYYGHYVTNYNSPNDAGINVLDGQLGKWQIFMADDTNIYLMASNVITAQYLGKKNNKEYTFDSTESTVICFSNDILGEYNANTTSTDIPQILSRLNKQSEYHKWMNTPSNQTKNQANEKAVASMLDIDVWSGYNNTKYAQYAIGGPSLEMLCRSYNNSHTGEKLSVEETSFGYKIIKGTESSENGKGELGTGQINDYINDMLFSNYWISSPSNINSFPLYSNRGRTGGYVGNNGSYSANYSVNSFKPLVCLNSNVHLVLNEDGQTYSLELN